jgi:sugar phosphate permease
MGALDRVRDFFLPEPAIEPIRDPDAINAEFARWRKKMFFAMFTGYAVLYFCRKNIPAALPVMGDELHYSNTELGLISSTLYVTYGLGKFANGVLADGANIRGFLCTALVVSGLINLAFGSIATLWAFAFLWGANGWFQSMGFPPIARGMTLWYTNEGKATRWAFWTCSHQAGTAAVMGLTGWILTWGSWRWCFWLPAVMCVVLGVVLWFMMADTPESKGLRSIEAFAPAPEEATESYWLTFRRCVLLNRNVWAIGLADLFAYVVRFGALDWVPKFLKEERGYQAGSAAFSTAIMPLFGVAGVLCAGVISDRLFKSRYRSVNITAFAVLGVMLWGFWAIGNASPWLDLVMMAGVGFFVEVPQSLLGAVAAVDAGGSARVASSAAGLVGFLSYVGATASGVGTGYVIDLYGWGGAFALWIGCGIAGLLICWLFWKEAPVTRSE